MEKQRDIFIADEGDQWFRRNRPYLSAVNDPVLRVLTELAPARLLEVGAANGWRLAEARRRWGAQGTGVEPSQAARNDGAARFPEVTLLAGTADRLPLDDRSVDCVVFGWCLYLCDRADLFRIAAEADRVLASPGYVVVYDFFTPAPYSNPYCHREGVRSFKMDHSVLWSWHPAYTVWRHEVMGFHGADPANVDDRLAVTVLRRE